MDSPVKDASQLLSCCAPRGLPPTAACLANRTVTPVPYFHLCAADPDVLCLFWLLCTPWRVMHAEPDSVETQC